MSLQMLVNFILSMALMEVQTSEPIVSIPQGVLLGTWKLSYSGRLYASFNGIPFASPPVREYRFREPQPPEPWQGVRDATKSLSVCLQYDPLTRKIVGSEDCLFVSVYTPKLNSSALLPVVIFIHGGAFMFGAGSEYDASYLMNRDMVYVGVNYRLGPLGFLSTGDNVIPGNAGLKDQSFAIKWVKNNILMFGGNPDSITLTGLSAGGASVHYHYLSPMSRDTFHRGITFSGSAFASWTYAVNPAEKAHRLAVIVGCPSANHKEMADCLISRPAKDIVGAQTKMFGWRVKSFTPFTPTREAANVKEPFITEHPFPLAQSGRTQKLPLITSNTAAEGLYPAAYYQTDPTILQELNSHWEQLASNIFEYNDTLCPNQRSVVATRIKHYYFGEKSIGQESFNQLVQALGDRHFAAGVGKMAQYHAMFSGQPTYLYRFLYRGARSLTNLIVKNEENYGVSHADDVLYFFKFTWSSESPTDMQMRNILLDMLYSYASTGIPKIKDEVDWLPILPNSSDLNYLEIASPSSIVMKSIVDYGNKSFWDSLGLNEYENYTCTEK